MEVKLAVTRVDVSRETGEIMLLMETACGFRPLIGWPSINGMEDFARALLRICSQEEEKDSVS